MNVLTKPRMTVDEFLAWAEGRPGRYELFKGDVYAMSPETVGHLEAKAAVHAALLAGIRALGLPCYVLPDGATVRIDNETAYEPDALVYCGQKLPPSALEIPSPIIVVEVLSPSTARMDATTKLRGYFDVPSIQHYLIVDPEGQTVTHHKRGAAATETRVVAEGTLTLGPPGLEIRLGDIFAPA